MAPGFIDTDTLEALPVAMREEYLALILEGRLGRATQIADAVHFLVSPAASYVNGYTVVSTEITYSFVDGGPR